MQGIEFEEDNSYRQINKATGQAQGEGPKQSILTKLVFKLGVTDPTVANYVLLGIAAIFFGVTIFLYAGALNGHKYDPSIDARVILERIKGSQ